MAGKKPTKTRIQIALQALRTERHANHDDMAARILERDPGGKHPTTRSLANEESGNRDLRWSTVVRYLVGIDATLYDLAEKIEGPPASAPDVPDIGISILSAQAHIRAKNVEIDELKTRIKSSAITAEDFTVADELLERILKEFDGDARVQGRIRTVLASMNWRPRDGMTTSELSKLVGGMLADRTKKKGNGSG